eukprot:g32.t1
MMPAPNNITGNNGFEGWGVVTDPQTGALVFYTDGEDVFDADHQPVTPPGGLGANPSSSQAVAVAVNPVCPFDEYYIFSNPTGVFNGNTDGPVTYRLYTVGSGFSDVQLLPGPEASSTVGEGMTVIPSKTDPFTSWLVVRLLTPTAAGSEYVVYEINEMGISFNDVYTFGPAITDDPYSPIMNMTYTDNGSAEDVVVGFSVSGSPNRVFTNTFNTTTGTFGASANVVATFSAGTLYDLAFSPGGNYIYYASYFPSRLYQVPTAGGTAQQMYSFGNLRGGGLKAAPDGYVYHIYDAGANDNSGQIEASGGSGQLMYSLNGSDFTGQTDYANLSSGLYSVIVMDELGCTASQVVEVEQTQAGPMIDAVTINPASCLDGDGSVEIMASGGLGLIRYALVSPEFQTSGVFTAVSAGLLQW